VVSQAFPAFPAGFEEQEPEAAFFRGLRANPMLLGGQDPTKSMFGRFLQRQAPAFGTAFRFGQLLNPPASASANPFEDFVRTSTLPGIRNQSRNLFNQLATSMEGTAPRIREQFSQPTEEQAGDLGNLAVQALLSRISPLSLSLLNIPTGGQLRTQFLADNPTGGNFIDFMRQRLGLGGGLWGGVPGTGQPFGVI